MARLAASRKAPTMPGRAAGRTTLRMVSDWVAPSPSEPSRRLWGTGVMMSSDSEEMKGMSMIPMTRPAVSALVPDDRCPTAAPRPAQERADGDQREKAVDDGGDAGEDLDHRLDERRDARREAYSRQIDRASSARAAPRPAWRWRDDDSVPQSSGRMPSVASRRSKRGIPDGAEEEVEPVDEGEEVQGLEDQRSDDADRGQDGDERAGDQQAQDQALDLVAGPQLRRDARRGDQRDRAQAATAARTRRRRSPGTGAAPAAQPLEACTSPATPSPMRSAQTPDADGARPDLIAAAPAGQPAGRARRRPCMREQRPQRPRTRSAGGRASQMATSSRDRPGAGMQRRLPTFQPAGGRQRSRPADRPAQQDQQHGGDGQELHHATLTQEDQ